MTVLKRIGLLAHPMRPYTAPIAEQMSAWLRVQGVETWVFTTDWEPADVAKVIGNTDMVIAIGGDGAMLHAARVCAPYDVPMLGLNMGRLGFLTEIKGPDDWESSLMATLNGNYWIEQRMLVEACVYREEACIASGDALNDIVIGRGSITRHIVQLDAYIDDEWATSYNADALIVATATGSTAYALACGGPILPPELRNILMVPVASHLSLERAMVLPEGARVEIVVAPESSDAALAVDGELMVELQPGDSVMIQASRHISRFVRLRERNYFYRSLLDRLEPRLPGQPRPQRRQTPGRKE